MKDWYNIVVCNLWWFWHLGHSSSIQWAVLIQIRFTKQRWYQILAKYILYAKLKQQKLFTMPCRCNMAMVFGDQALICWTRPLLLLPTDGGSTQEFSFKNPNALPPYVPARRAENFNEKNRRFQKVFLQMAEEKFTSQLPYQPPCPCWSSKSLFHMRCIYWCTLRDGNPFHLAITKNQKPSEADGQNGNFSFHYRHARRIWWIMWIKWNRRIRWIWY